MHEPTRRRFLIGAAAGAASLGAAGLSPSLAAAEPVLILGGGPAGVQAALALGKTQPKRPVILVERDPIRFAGGVGALAPFSRPATPDAHSMLAAADVQIILDDVAAVDWTNGRVELFSGRRIAFETLIAAPGVSPRDEGIEGLDPVARHLWPAAWGSTREGQRLAGQLAAMSHDAHVLLRLPPDAGESPQIAVERILRIAAYLARTRPQARFTVLDPDEGSQASRLFTAHQSDPGAARVAWVDGTSGGRVLSVDAPRGVLETSAGTLHADVVNFIPLQGAADIARLAGLTDDSGWCPCDGAARSLQRPQAMVLGDARLSAIRTVAAAVKDGEQGALLL